MFQLKDGNNFVLLQTDCIHCARMSWRLVLICCVSLQWLDMAFAPVPRCSPFIGPINKLVESNSLTADFNPYFPVPPCEHGGPLQAVLAGDFESVFLLARPEKIPRHNIYEGKWLHTEGPRRLARILAGEVSRAKWSINSDF